MSTRIVSFKPVSIADFLPTLIDGPKPVRNPAECFARDDAEDQGFIHTFMVTCREELFPNPGGGHRIIGDSQYIWAELTALGRDLLGLQPAAIFPRPTGGI